MLEEAGIKFYIKNETNRSLSPRLINADLAITMELCVETNRLKEAKEIYQNINKSKTKNGTSFQELSYKTDKIMIIVAILIVLIIIILKII